LCYPGGQVTTEKREEERDGTGSFGELRIYEPQANPLTWITLCNSHDNPLKVGMMSPFLGDNTSSQRFIHLSKVTQTANVRARVCIGLLLSFSSPGDILGSRRSSGLGLGGRRSRHSSDTLSWVSASDILLCNAQGEVGISAWRHSECVAGGARLSGF
jgi:hypothetical protein